MLHEKTVVKTKIVMFAFIMATLVGCGGGRASTTTTTGDVENTPLSSGGNPVPVPTVPNTTGSATLNWLPPTTHTDGSAISALASQNIYMNTGSGYKLYVQLKNPGLTTYVVENLVSGNYSFVVTAVDESGAESAYSNAASVNI